MQKFSNLTVKNLSFPCQAAKRTQTKNSKTTAVDFLCRALWDYCAATTLLHSGLNPIENMSYIQRVLTPCILCILCWEKRCTMQKMHNGSVASHSHFDKVLALSKFTLLKCKNDVNPVTWIPWATAPRKLKLRSAGVPGNPC